MSPTPNPSVKRTTQRLRRWVPLGFTHKSFSLTEGSHNL